MIVCIWDQKNFITDTTFFSQTGEDAKSKKRRTCRAGAGIEADFGMCNTPGFKLRDDFELRYDHRGY